jgi:hypothetical protein
MKYQVGDDIIVLHSNEEGKVIEIMNDKMVMIEVRGVKFPAYMDQIDFPYFARFTKNKVVEDKKPAKKYVDQVPKEKPVPNAIKTSDGVWLSFVPKFTLDEFNDEVVDLLKIYLVNKTDKGFHFTYRQDFLGEENFGLKNDVLAFHDFYLHDISFASLNDSPSFHFEFSLVTPAKNKAEFYETALKLKPKQVFQRIEEMKAKNEPTVVYKLFGEYPDKTQIDKPELSGAAQKAYNMYEANKTKQNLEPARSVIDLHMEKLSDNWKHISNFEILTMQLKEFEKWYELALAHHLPSMVVIHGVGTGKLRDEIHDILKAKRDVRFFINQYDPRFGYGATEIFFNT